MNGAATDFDENLPDANAVSQSLSQRRRSQSQKRFATPMTDDSEQMNTECQNQEEQPQPSRKFQSLSAAKQRAKSHNQDELSDIQQGVLPEEYFLDNLATYLKEQTAGGPTDGKFIKVYDLRKALQGLNCNGVTADDVENLVNVLATSLLNGTELRLQEDGGSRAQVLPGSGAYALGYTNVRDQVLKIDDVVARLKEL